MAGGACVVGVCGRGAGACMARGLHVRGGLHGMGRVCHAWPPLADTTRYGQ